MRDQVMTPQPMENAARVLRRVFGLRKLRPGQQPVIERILQGRSTLAVMPTGSGKSLCYQLPSMLLPGITVVVSPLIALMKDQCERLQALGVEAVEFNSSLDADTAAAADEALQAGTARVVFVTPERFCSPEFTKQLQSQRVSLVVIDEAHCISQWGHDFRPAFLEIGPALRRMGGPTVLALTATAPEDVAAEIARELAIGADGIVQTGIWRENLRYGVELLAQPEDKLRRLQELVARLEGPGIVYTATVRAAQEVHALLLSQGVAAGLYHGKQRAALRHAAQEAFMAGSVRVMVATNAFGMGIDKADVRFVLHFQLPPSLEAYYQESGRAGRDGLPADCILLYLRSDRAVQQFLGSGRPVSTKELEAVLGALSPEVAASTAQIQQRAGLSKGRLSALLALLQQEHHCRKAGRAAGAGWLLATGRGKRRGLDDIVQAECARRREREQKLEAAVAYAEGGGCRWNAISQELQGEPMAKGCGICDNCLRMRELAQEEGTAVPAMAAAPRQMQVGATAGGAAGGAGLQGIALA